MPPRLNVSSAPRVAPKVTVFIPAYNREAYIGAAVRSILAQTFTDFELLVIDDGSRDRTAAIVEAFDDPRVRLERNDGNRGIPYTRNRGLELARGEYLAILDSDDIALPSRLARQVAFLDAAPQFAEVGSWSRYIDAAGTLAPGIKRQPTDAEAVRAHLLFRCCLNNRTVTGRTALMRELGYNEDFPRCQDYELHVRLAERHRLGNLPEVLVHGRRHDEQITGQTEDLGRRLKGRIAAVQLERLDLSFSDDDLLNHYRLPRLRRLEHDIDAAYLDWAEDWLTRIGAANRRHARYPQAALRRVLGQMWLKACRAAPGGMRRALRGPLTGALLGNAVPALRTRLAPASLRPA